MQRGPLRHRCHLAVHAEPAQIGATADRAGLFVLGVREQAAER